MNLFNKLFRKNSYVYEKYGKHVESIDFSIGKVFFLEKGKKYYVNKDKLERFQIKFSSYLLNNNQKAPYNGVCILLKEKAQIEQIFANTDLVPNNYVCGINIKHKSIKIIIFKDSLAISKLEFMDNNLIEFKRYNV